jgi:hypothetical protein
MPKREILTPTALADDSPRVFEVFCSKLWRLCSINVRLLLILVLGTKFLTGNNPRAHRRNTPRRSRRSARKKRRRARSQPAFELEKPITAQRRQCAARPPRGCPVTANARKRARCRRKSRRRSASLYRPLREFSCIAGALLRPANRGLDGQKVTDALLDSFVQLL